jgi:hypothetical protein
MIIASSAESGWNCIFRNTAGIVFLGTPHRGSHLASAASSISRRIPGSSQLLPILQANSSTLAQIAERFNNIWGTRPLFSFRETTGTIGFMVICCLISLQFLLTNFNCQIIVLPENAVTNCQNETVYDIPHCNHSELSKPDSITGLLFPLIIRAILSLLHPKSSEVYSSNSDAYSLNSDASSLNSDAYSLNSDAYSLNKDAYSSNVSLHYSDVKLPLY